MLLRSVPVVVLSGSREERDVVETYNLGVNSYIVKPIDIAHFVETMQMRLTVGHPLDLLIVEDSESDAELVAGELRRHGFDVAFERVDTGPALEAALEAREWLLVLCDYNLPGFDSQEALRIIRERGNGLPFVILSGTIGEEAAVEALRAGAMDIVVKTNLSRVGAVVDRVLLDAENHRKLRKGEAALLESEARKTSILESALDAVITIDQEGRILDFNAAAEAMFGYTRAEVTGEPMAGLIVPPSLRHEHEEGVRAPSRYRGDDDPRHSARGDRDACRRRRVSRRARGHEQRALRAALLHRLPSRPDRGEAGRGRTSKPRGSAPPVSEDGGDRQARRGHHPRLQQPPGGRERLQRDPAAGVRRGGPAPGARRADPVGRREGQPADAAATCLRPSAGAPAEGSRPERDRHGNRADAGPLDRRRGRARHPPRPRARPRSGGPGPSRAGDHEPGGQRRGRDGRGRHA